MHVLACLVAATCALAVSADQPLHRPHILLVVADDYGWNDIGYHQNNPSSANPEGRKTTSHVINTPNLDRLANQGIKLENYYVQPLCSPTRGTILTGRYPSHTGVGPQIVRAAGAYGMPGDEVMLPELLADAGYATHMVGKWHLGFCDKRYTPTFRGFQSFKGYLLGQEDYFLHNASKKPYSALDFRQSSLHSKWVFPNVSRASTGIYSTDVFTRRVDDIVKAHVATHQEKRNSIPLFLYMAFQSVHHPLQAPQKYIDMYSYIADKSRRIYAAMVTAMDDAIGTIEQSYKQAGLWDHTVFVFTTDNGGPLVGANNYPLRGHKGGTWEGGVRGVAFVRGAAGYHVPAGSSSMELMHATDWLPTLASIAGVSHEGNTKPLDGYDVSGVLFAGTRTARQFVVHNCPAAGAEPGGAFRMGPYKLMYRSSPGDNMQTHQGSPQTLPPGFHGATCPPPKPTAEGIWLFNVLEDPQECYNLADCPKHFETLRHLKNRFKEYQKGAVPDLLFAHGQEDPAADPSRRPDRAWGPYIGSTLCKFKGTGEELFV